MPFSAQERDDRVGGNARGNKENEAWPRLTIRRSTRPATFDHIVRGEKESVIFLKDRSLTKGYALVRRARAVVGGVLRSA